MANKPKKPKKERVSPVTLWILSYFVPAFLWLVKRTSRWELIHQEHRDGLINSGKPFIATFWHGRILMAAQLREVYPGRFMMLSSEHRDGDLIVNAVKRLKIEFARGSTANPLKKHKNKHGTSALLTLYRAMQDGVAIGMTPDGPRGPRQHLQPGIIHLSVMANAPILPIGMSVKRGKQFDSWDKFLLPLPFTKGYYVFGAPMRFSDESDAGIEKARVELETELNRLTHEADIMAQRTPTGKGEPKRRRHQQQEVQSPDNKGSDTRD